MKRILFICHGNICRSPMAEFVMKDLVQKAGLAAQFHIESAATSREEIGNPVYPPAHPGNVADPWYTEDFEATWQDVLDGCQGLLKEFMTERGDSNGTKR